MATAVTREKIGNVEIIREEGSQLIETPASSSSEDSRTGSSLRHDTGRSSCSSASDDDVDHVKVRVHDEMPILYMSTLSNYAQAGKKHGKTEPLLIPNNPTCSLCQDLKYRSTRFPRHARRYIKPCFCDNLYHHGCLASLITDKHLKSCSYCGEKYDLRWYGSKWDFLKRYRLEFGIYTTVCLIILAIAIFAIVSALKSASNFSVLRLLLLLTGIVLFIAAFCIAFTLIRHIMIYRFPRFRARYAQLTIFDYDPHAVKKRKFNVMGDSINIEHGADGKLELSVGQHILGHQNSYSHHSTSTPIEGHSERERFVFESPR